LEPSTDSCSWEQKLEKLLELSERLHSTLDTEKALPMVLECSMELIGMQRGFVMLYNSERELSFRLGRDSRGRPLGAEQFQVSRTLIRKAIEQQSLQFFVNPSEINSSSVYKLQLCCGCCVPLFSYRTARAGQEARRIIGILYLDSQRALRFGEHEERLAAALGTQAGLALENAILHELATRDGLTRLYRRQYVEEAARIEWKRSHRHGHDLSILMLDFDFFKNINDACGHATGDQVLRKSAERIRGVCREEDLVGRYGGEEFVIVLPETGVAQATTVAERIHHVMRTGQLRPDRKPVTVSIGLASYPKNPAESVKDLIEFADLALYQAKESGRNRTSIYGA
jgi:diguanylate cyclase (GGDEF)-like protein